MAHVPWRRLTGAVIGAVPEYGDVGPFEAVVEPHPYLHCWDCGRRLHRGQTFTAAPILTCTHCKRIVDVRRLD